MENLNKFFFNDDKEKRRIDDPLLNQDHPYDPNEDFDDTDDFHKYDDTAEDDTSESNDK